ncbi:29656_t:CDS:1, partial [Racocetra persica]
INLTSNVLLVGTKNKPNVQCISGHQKQTQRPIYEWAPRMNPTSNVLVGTKNKPNVQYISRNQE